MGFLDYSIFGVTVARMFVILFVLLGAIILNFIVRKLMNRIIKSSKVVKGDQKTGLVVLKNVLTAIILVGGLTIAIMMIPALEKVAISLFAGAGILAIIIGFASQQAFSNIVSGIFIAIFRPFRIGDTLKFQDKMGVVEDITLRHTIIRNYENKRFIVPNSVISQEIIENSHLGEEKVCRHVEFGISYDSDIDKAMKIMQEEAIKHPEFLDNRDEDEKKSKKHPITVRLMGFGDSSVNLRAYVWAATPHKAFKLGTDLNKSIKERFDKEGIEIPFPYRTIVYKKDIPKKLSKKKKRR